MHTVRSLVMVRNPSCPAQFAVFLKHVESDETSNNFSSFKIPKFPETVQSMVQSPVATTLLEVLPRISAEERKIPVAGEFLSYRPNFVAAWRGTNSSRPRGRQSLQARTNNAGNSEATNETLFRPTLPSSFHPSARNTVTR